MRSIKAAVFVLAALLGIVVWATNHAGWRHQPAPRAPNPSAQKAEPPVVEFREVQSGPAGETGTLLTINRAGLATLQTLPLGPGSKAKRIHLNCDQIAWLPQRMKEELADLRPSYGSERGVNQGEVSVVYRWDGPERRVAWRNPESSPKPPEGQWAGLVAPLEDIRRLAVEPSQPAASTGDVDDVVVEYGHLSSGAVGTYFTLLSIHKFGPSDVGARLGVALARCGRYAACARGTRHFAAHDRGGEILGFSVVLWAARAGESTEHLDGLLAGWNGEGSHLDVRTGRSQTAGWLVSNCGDSRPDLGTRGEAKARKSRSPTAPLGL